MPCATDGTTSICYSSGVYRRRYLHCPVCERRRRFVQHFGGLWYPDNFTCLGCGDTWQGSELMPRPFRPRWRRESMAAARKHWANAVSPAQYRAVIDAEWAAERAFAEAERERMDAESVRANRAVEDVPVNGGRL